MNQRSATSLGLFRQAWACFAGFLLLATQGQAQNVVMTMFPLSGTNGAFPHSQLIQASDGNFYGTAQQGGATTNAQPFFGGIGNGCVFKMTANGMITALASFFGTNGSHPWGGLVEADDGNLYGTTYDGGDYPGSAVGAAPGVGTVFRITTDGTLTTIFSFMATNGANPVTALTKGADGALYGTTRAGGSTFGDPRSFDNAGFGTLFKITTNGQFTSLFSFSSNSYGFSPFSTMTLSSDGNLYGVVYSTNYPATGASQVFRITPAGAVSTFAQADSFVGICTLSSPVQGRDGQLYAASGTGGSFHYGGVYKISADGFESMIVSFTNAVGNSWGSMVEGTDGNLYGVRSGGEIFRVTPDGIYRAVVSFSANAISGLIQAKDGSLYGASAGYNYYGNPNDAGFLFRVSIPSAAAPKLKTPSKSGNTIGLSWSAIPRRSYQVQSAMSLAGGVWTNVGDTVIASGSVAVTFDSSAANGSSFYRVVMLP